MKPPPFDYVLADSVESAVTALAQAGSDAKIIAGGQSLVPMLNFRLLKPTLLVDINAISGLSFIDEDDDAIRIGALTRHRMLETSPVIARQLSVITEAMGHVAHLAIRNRGTIGGSLSHADPAAELPMLALLLDAELTIASPRGRRSVAARDFFLGALTVDLHEDELVTEIKFPKLPPSTGWGFAEVARRGGDFALAAVAVALTLEAGAISAVRIGMMGIGETPQRAHEAEALLLGRRLDVASLAEVGDVVRTSVTPNTDVHASSDYRRHLVAVLAERTLREAWERAAA
ncbi:MAG TPA: xanthine dehydrogenase family protein subunit M [Pseudolabrys sp.]|nr:xanthine dehydrogenase family protein subunit M [Pseudolabrys sp.]